MEYFSAETFLELTTQINAWRSKTGINPKSISHAVCNYTSGEVLYTAIAIW